MSEVEKTEVMEEALETDMVLEFNISKAGRIVKSKQFWSGLAFALGNLTGFGVGMYVARNQTSEDDDLFYDDDSLDDFQTINQNTTEEHTNKNLS